MYKKRFLSAVLAMSLLVTQASVMAQVVSVNEVWIKKKKRAYI